MPLDIRNFESRDQMLFKLAVKNSKTRANFKINDHLFPKKYAHDLVIVWPQQSPNRVLDLGQNPDLNNSISPIALGK